MWFSAAIGTSNVIAAEHPALLLAWGACFTLTLVSAVMPWVNAEVALLTFTATASSRSAMAVFVVIATAGQMTGKLLLYSAGRQGSRVRSPRISRLLDTWRPRWLANPKRADWIVLVSSAVGFPPFIVTTLLAGALRMDIVRFVVAGSVGRLVHFGTVAAVGDVVARLVVRLF